MSKSLIIIPTYNEIENVEAIVSSVLDQDTPAHLIDVLVVDDASADGTARVVEQMAQDDPRVRLLERPAKLGLGTAYIAGFRQALEGGYDFVGTMDADFSHPPECLSTFLEVIAHADVVIGSRYVPGGGIRNWGPHRHVLSATANFLARLAGGLATKDCTTGYRLYRTDFLRRLNLNAITSHGYSCLIELVFVCQRARGRIVESPIVFVDRRAGHSKISSNEIFRAFATLWRLFMFRVRGGKK